MRIDHADGKSEVREYDDWGRLTNHFGAGQYPIAYEYDALGNLAAMTDGEGSRTAWTHDSRNRVTRKTYDDGSFYDYAYDPNGNLTRRTDALGRETLYTYDARNQLVSTVYENDPALAFGYDLLGRRTNLVDGLGAQHWAYDAAHRLVAYENDYTGALLEYEHDAEGRRTALTVNGRRTDYAYDAAGQMSSVSNEVGAFHYTWHPDARLVSALQFPSGAAVTNAYDVLRRLTGKYNLDATNGVVSSFEYGYDAVNLRTNQVHQDGTGRAYEYDDLRQLTGANGFLSVGGADTNFVYAYGYDLIGNYTQTVRGAMTELYEPNSLNQYTNRVRTTNGGVTNRFVYDLNGNLLDDGTLHYAWDEENRLVAVSNGTWRSEFDYDGLWRRTETREYVSGTLVSVRRHVYDGWLPVAELDETNGLVRAMTWGLDLSLSFEGAGLARHRAGGSGAGGIGGLLALSEGTTNLFYLYDGNGNVVDVLDDADDLAAHYEYEPFGALRVAEGPHADQPFQWSTKLHHEPSGLVYYGYRFLAPDLGRWLSREPLGEAGALNLFGFIVNSPVNVLDYLGLAAVAFPGPDGEQRWFG